MEVQLLYPTLEMSTMRRRSSYVSTLHHSAPELPVIRPPSTGTFNEKSDVVVVFVVDKSYSTYSTFSLRSSCMNDANMSSAALDIDIA